MNILAGFLAGWTGPAHSSRSKHRPQKPDVGSYNTNSSVLPRINTATRAQGTEQILIPMPNSSCCTCCRICVCQVCLCTVRCSSIHYHSIQSGFGHELTSLSCNVRAQHFGKRASDTFVAVIKISSAPLASESYSPRSSQSELGKVELSPGVH